MSYSYETIVLEVAKIEREAFEAVRRKIAARQLGEAWKGLENVLPVEDRRKISA